MFHSGLRRLVAAIVGLTLVCVVAAPLWAHDDPMDMECCEAGRCQTAALSAPCCAHETASLATPVSPARTTTIHVGVLPTAIWAAVFDGSDAAGAVRRARTLDALARGTPPDPAHVRFHSLLI